VGHLTTLTYLELNDNSVKRLEDTEGLHKLEVGQVARGTWHVARGRDGVLRHTAPPHTHTHTHILAPTCLLAVEGLMLGRGQLPVA
jgi:hypothetical protein